MSESRCIAVALFFPQLSRVQRQWRSRAGIRREEGDGLDHILEGHCAHRLRQAEHGHKQGPVLSSAQHPTVSSGTGNNCVSGEAGPVFMFARLSVLYSLNCFVTPVFFSRISWMENRTIFSIFPLFGSWSYVVVMVFLMYFEQFWQSFL